MLCMCSLWPHARELRMYPFSLCCYRYHYQGLCSLRVCCFQLPTQCTSVAGEPTSPLLITEFKATASTCQNHVARYASLTVCMSAVVCCLVAKRSELAALKRTALCSQG